MSEGTYDYCPSCGMPLDHPDAKGLSEHYCKHCTDEGGELKSRDEIKEGMAGFLMQWQHIDRETALKRAEHYMKAMPEWAED